MFSSDFWEIFKNAFFLYNTCSVTFLSIDCFMQLNTSPAKVSILYPLKTPKKPKIFWYFQGV